MRTKVRNVMRSELTYRQDDGALPAPPRTRAPLGTRS